MQPYRHTYVHHTFAPGVEQNHQRQSIMYHYNIIARIHTKSQRHFIPVYTHYDCVYYIGTYMYVCSCMCVKYMRACVHGMVCTCMYIHVCMCMCMYLCACVCTCVHICVYVCTCVYVCVCTCVYMHVYMCVLACI